MDWLLLAQIVYVLILIVVCGKIIYDTRSNVKTLAYLLVAIFIPIIGMLFYFTIGINYRKHKMYSKKILDDNDLAKHLKEDILHISEKAFAKGGSAVRDNKELAVLLLSDINSALTEGNHVKLLVNGEKKFPEVISALKEAKHHIHIEYYIYDDDTIGREIEQLLIQKAKEGVDVRFIYDDFGSRSLRKGMVGRLEEAGVKSFPFYRIRFIALANRINYRNHRKIIVIDGQTAFIGGINVSDKYINQNGNGNTLFWRDTHLRIDGPGVYYLQYLFLCDWNFCAGSRLKPDTSFFPSMDSFPKKGKKLVQIAASGPDSDMPTILFSLLQAINLAEEEILITTPYFIPGESLMDALCIASLGGLSVKLLVPGVSDSKLVNAASSSYYEELLHAGVEIYLYQKGFVHAKTLVADRKVAIIGTANMDTRSFDLNFEVNAVVYDEELANELADVFYDDLKDAEKIEKESWNQRGRMKKLTERTARLLSPLL